MCTVLRTTFGALLVCSIMGSSLRILAQEPLPTPPQTVGGDPTNSPSDPDFYCPTFDNRPLTALTVDTQPLDPTGKVVPKADLPQNCMPAPATEAGPMFLGSNNFDCSCREVLQLARFYHPQLFFEDPLLERYGFDYVCPSFHALGEFTCDLVLLPARLLVNKHHPCMRTPTPHCFSACGICGY